MQRIDRNAHFLHVLFCVDVDFVVLSNSSRTDEVCLHVSFEALFTVTINVNIEEGDSRFAKTIAMVSQIRCHHFPEDSSTHSLSVSDIVLHSVLQSHQVHIEPPPSEDECAPLLEGTENISLYSSNESLKFR